MTDRVAARREEILDAAERIFADKGYHDAGIADIASDLGIGHGTFYRYFRNKQDIATRVLERVVNTIAQPALAEDPQAAMTLAEYRAQVGRIVAGMFDIVERHPHVMRFFHRQSLVVDARALGEALDAWSAYTAQFLDNGVRRGFLRADLDIEVTAQQLNGLVLEGTRRALAARQSPQLRRRWMDAGIALMFDGISAPPQ